MQHTIVEEGRARAPAGAGPIGKVLVGGHLALGGATVVIMAFSLAFVCTLDNGTQPWTWPGRYSAAWFVAAAIVSTTLWALFVTGTVIFSSRPRRALGTATFFVAAALGAAAVIGLFGPSESSALQLWLVCAMNLGYQAAHLRST
ncbi:hypothetical protein JWS13_13250 [Rhodococcus pseudokoreensis]|uniref:Integral membrane protein n=1 Tax=Rhodococcus pseudokoreensis TaxID=2811421 RepID=A0A974W1X3_9NOCA|nr:hypothetical protein [Rhodococcus pseudokoreensis]QSE89521.1 hypothetical protein JWS13_13250 [Rhodococcus pseudokoreensis]